MRITILMFLNDILPYSFIFCLFYFVNISLALFALRLGYQCRTQSFLGAQHMLWQSLSAMLNSHCFCHVQYILLFSLSSLLSLSLAPG